MQRILYTVAGMLLLFNGIGAIYGGLSLIRYRDGSGLDMGTEWLQHSPFDNYLIPGIILLVVNGFFSMVCFGMLLLRYRHSGRYIISQGVLLTGWIMVQILLIQTINTLHIVMGTTGIMLTICGAIVTLRYQATK